MRQGPFYEEIFIQEPEELQRLTLCLWIHRQVWWDRSCQKLDLNVVVQLLVQAVDFPGFHSSLQKIKQIIESQSHWTHFMISLIIL